MLSIFFAYIKEVAVLATYIELSVMARGLTALWFVFILVIANISTFRLFSQRNYILAVPSTAVMIVSYILLQWCSDIGICFDKGLKPPHSSVLIDKAEVGWMIVLGVFLSLFALCFLVYAHHYGKSHVTASSLKEGIDNLPSGLCWYYDDGTVALRNRVMEQLCYRITGHDLNNGADFENRIRSMLDEANVIKLPDQSVWSIVLSSVTKDRTLLHEICAYDITEEYKTTRLLEEKQAEAQAANDSLMRYSRELAQMITAEEILAAKVRIHDELGHGLLLTRKYLLRGGNEEDKEKLIQVLRKNNTLMESSEKNTERSYLEMIFDAAADMGVKIVVEGEMPKSPAVSDVITTAIHENLTNTIRHAKGDEMHVILQREGSRLNAVFTNNGKAPDGPVEERGGLAMLRALVTAAGGEMIIESDSGFKMTLRFNLEE